MTRRLVPWLLAALAYVALTVVLTWPLVVQLPVVLASDLGDPVLNTWIIWWNAHAVPLTARWWDGPMFWPSSGSLAFSETLIGLMPITTPIQWLGGSPSTAYNVAFFLTFPLSALATHALVFRLTRRHDAALLGGLIYGFHPFRVAHFPQIQVMTSYWMPTALLGLHAYLESKRRPWLWLSAGAWLMQALSNGYYLLFFPVLAGLWIVWFTLSPSRIRTMAAILGAWAVASIPLVPLLWGYHRIHDTYGFQRDLGEVNFFGADVVSLLDISPLSKFWHLHSFHQAEGELFPGLTASLLVLLVVIQWLWTSERDKRAPRACLVLLIAAIAFIGVALSAMLFGPWTITIAGTTLVSVRVVSKPLSIGVLLFIAALALEPRFVGTLQRRSALLFYTLATATMYLLCFGPQPRFLGVPFMYRAPYSWLMALPGYDAVRVPARFAMLAALCLSVAAALAFVRLTSRARWPSRATLAGFAIAGILIDSWISETPLPRLPGRLKALESQSATPVLELPLGETGDDVAAMYRGMYHGRAIVNGYSGFFPASYDALKRGLTMGDPQMFDAIAAWGPVTVAVDRNRDTGGRWVSQLASRPETVDLGEEANWKFFLLKAGSLPTYAARPSDRLEIHSLSANVNSERIARALDGNSTTRWDSGPQRGGETVVVDLGSPRTIRAVTMTITGHLSDFPRMLVVETSNDGEAWTEQWQGATGVLAFAGAVRNPRQTPLTIPLPSVSARLMRLRQLGHDPVFYWTIAELEVFGK